MTEPREARVLVQLFFSEAVDATVLEVWRPDDDDGRSLLTLRFSAEQAQQLYAGRAVELEVTEARQ